MLIQITNSCDMACPHCLDDCKPGRQHMDDATFTYSLAFAHKCASNVIVISGGEPSLHPKFVEWTERCAIEFCNVVVASNGAWLGTETEDEIVSIIKKHPNIDIQITSVKGLYRLHEETIRLFDKFKARTASLPNLVTIHTGTIWMSALGRAATNSEYSAMAAENTKCSTSCFSSALVSAQIPLAMACGIMEMRGHFCHPLVDWNGMIHWSESVLCPSFASVTEDFDKICASSMAWRPCGKCADYGKLIRMAKTDMKYKVACGILGINTNG